MITKVQRATLVLFALPIFLFTLSVAGASIASGLYLLCYLLSGYWRNWRAVLDRRWALPLALLVAWTLLGSLWSIGTRADVWTALSRMEFFLVACTGATLPWTRARFLLFPRLFLSGLALNWVVGLMQWFHAWPWHPMRPGIGPIGYCGHITLSMLLTMAVIWIAYDLRERILLPRWANILMVLAFVAQLALGAGRTGQVEFIVLVPAAIWVLFRGRWRYWALGLAVLAILGMAASPMVHKRVAVGVQNLTAAARGDYSTSLGLRIYMAWGAVEMGLHHPVLGVGSGGYAQGIKRLQKRHTLPGLTTRERLSQPQNSFLIEFAMLGFPGLLLLIWYLWTLCVPAWRHRATPEGWFVLCYLAIFIVGSLSDTLIWGYDNVYILGMLTALSIPLPGVAAENA